jgi:hypothetical protein
MKAGPIKILDFDIENRPLSYLGHDFTTAEITAIACAWTAKPTQIFCWTLTTEYPESMREMLARFVEMYDRADAVTGHYIREHDLPIINAALLEQRMAPLSPKLTEDTKLDLLRRKDLSASQENLAAMLGLPAEKQHLSGAEWREANRLTKKGLEITRRRVTQDVRQHMALRQRLIELDYLGPMRVWTP